MALNTCLSMSSLMLGNRDTCEMFEIAPLTEDRREGYIWTHRILNCMPMFNGGRWGITDSSIVNERMKAWNEKYGYPYFGEDRLMAEGEAMAFFDQRNLPRPV